MVVPRPMMPRRLCDTLGGSGAGRAPHTGPRGLVQRQDATPRRTRRPQVWSVAHSRRWCLAPVATTMPLSRPGVGLPPRFHKSRAQHADQRGVRAASICARQADGADGERHRTRGAVFSNGGCSLRCIGRVDFKHPRPSGRGVLPRTKQDRAMGSRSQKLGDQATVGHRFCCKAHMLA